jgi:hypothetical protein
MQELFCSLVLSLVMVRVLLLRVIDSFGGFFFIVYIFNVFEHGWVLLVCS